MPRERIIETFILKRTDYGEADQITTFFSREEGKIRALVKAAKLPTSKLQPLLQPLFLSRVFLSGSKDSTGLAKVIGGQMIKAYGGIWETESKIAAWYVVSELLIRALPDHAPNEKLFDELVAYAEFLHATELEPDQVRQSVIQFQIKALDTLGLGIRSFTNTSEQLTENNTLWFSLDRGGFTDEDSVDAIPVKWILFQSFQSLSQKTYNQIGSVVFSELAQLATLINRFVIHQLERDIKSHELLANT
jgi:DNA repair protein RecO (recombination protein O)